MFLCESEIDAALFHVFPENHIPNFTLFDDRPEFLFALQPPSISPRGTSSACWTDLTLRR